MKPATLWAAPALQIQFPRNQGTDAEPRDSEKEPKANPLHRFMSRDGKWACVYSHVISLADAAVGAYRHPRWLDNVEKRFMSQLLH